MSLALGVGLGEALLPGRGVAEAPGLLEGTTEPGISPGKVGSPLGEAEALGLAEGSTLLGISFSRQAVRPVKSSGSTSRARDFISTISYGVDKISFHCTPLGYGAKSRGAISAIRSR